MDSASGDGGGETAASTEFITLPLIKKILDRYHRARIECFYDSEGRVYKQVQADGSETKFYYDERTTQVVYATGQWEKYDYRWYLGGYGYRLIRYRDSVGNDTTYEHGNGTGLTTAVSTTFGGQTRRVQMAWDTSTGNLLTVTVPTASGQTLSASAVYDPVWNVPTTIQDFSGIVSSVALDPHTGAPINTYDPRSGNTALFYSPQGDLLRVENDKHQIVKWEYTPRGEVKSVTDPENNTTQFGYDAASRLTAIRAPGAVMLGLWPGQPQAQYFLYNDMDQVTYSGNLPDPDGAWIPEFTYFGTRYDYDDEGNLVRVQLPGNTKYEWAYDALDRVKKARDPWGQESTVTYEAGRLKTVTDRAKNVATYAYGTSGMLSGVSVRKPNGALVSNVGYQYDARLRLQQITDSVTGSTHGYQYDTWDRCIGETSPQGNFSWELDDLGRRTRLLLPNHLPIEYVYNSLGQLNQVREHSPNGGFYNTKSFGYDVLGRVVSETLADLSNAQPQIYEVRTYDYTPAGRLLSAGISSGSGLFSSSRTLAYDAVGRMTQETVSRNGISNTNTFGYDVLDQVRMAHFGANDDGSGPNGPGQVYTWDYDTLGNRLTQTGGGLTTRSFYDSTAHLRLTRQITYQTPPGGEPGGYTPPANTIVSDANASYDVNGNLTDFGNGHYTWNALGQLTATSGSDAGGNTGFAYDVLGRRTVRNVPTTSPWGSAVPAWDGWMAANPFDRGGAFAGFKDLRGSTLGANVLNGTSNTTPTRFDFAPYGEVSTDPANVDVSQGEWAGMQIDNAKLYYARNRYYNPQMGRFISQDPIGLAGGLNPYMYCGGDPVNYTDPSGLLRIGPHDHPWLVFGEDDELIDGTAPLIEGRSYKCGGGDDEEMSDADMGSWRGGRSFRPGMHAGTKRSLWAKSATRGLKQEVYIAAGTLATAGLGMVTTTGAGATAPRSQSVVLATTEGTGGVNYLLKAWRQLFMSERQAGRLLLPGTKANVVTNTQAFAQELRQADAIYFSGEGMNETKNYVTWAEREYILRHPEFWDRTTIIHE